MPDKELLEQMLSIIKSWGCFIGDIKHYALITEELLVKPV